MGYGRRTFDQAPEDILNQSPELEPEALKAFADYAALLRLEGKSDGEIEQELAESFGGEILDHTEAIFTAIVEKTPRRKKTPQELASAIDPDKELSPTTVYNMAGGFLMQGIRGDDLINAILELIQQSLPDVTFNDVVDAYTGYGKTKFPSKAELAVLQRKEKRLQLLTRQIREIEKKRLPRLTGFQRDRLDPDDPDDRKIRAKIEERNQLMRDLNLVEDASDEGQMRGALSAIKTHY
jgi:hypothetical protein